MRESLINDPSFLHFVCDIMDKFCCTTLVCQVACENEQQKTCVVFLYRKKFYMKVCNIQLYTQFRCI